MPDLVHEKEERRARRRVLDDAHAARAVENPGRRVGDGHAAARARAVGHEDCGAERLRQSAAGRLRVEAGPLRGERRQPTAGDQGADGDAPSCASRRRRATSGGHTVSS